MMNVELTGKNTRIKGYHLAKNEHSNAEEPSKAISFLRAMIESRPGGERRPQQEAAVRSIEEAINNGEHLIVEAGTGTGKSFAAAIPAILSGERVVYSTATKQLSEQITNQDIPVLKTALHQQLGKNVSYALLKGRENYACKLKLDSLQSADRNDPNKGSQNQGLFAEEEVAVVEEEKPNSKRSAKKLAGEYKKIYNWVDKTRTGDVSEAPAVSDEVWKGISSTNAECVGRSSCPFGEICFAEAARDNARASQVVVTNHAITALDLENPESSLMGERSVFIFDEIHELDSYLSSAWGTTISAKMIADALILSRKFKPALSAQTSYETAMLALTEALDKFSGAIEDVDHGLFPENELPIRVETVLTEMLANVERILIIASTSVDDPVKNQMLKSFGNLQDSLSLFLVDSEENIRWAKNETMMDTPSWNTKKNNGNPAPATLHCAPLRIGPRLMKALHNKSATMIGTSATIKVGGKFDSAIHELSLAEDLDDGAIPHRPFKAVDVGTPFNYAKQAMVYVPNKDTFPSAEYKSRTEHSESVEDYSLRMIKALGGRALVLLTTTRRIEEVGDYLATYLPKGIKVLKQGDAPAPQLIEEFVNDETSVLVATMGMWHGLNAVGPTCSLVIMDKIPFPTVGDPLATARQNYANQQGRNGFMDVYVANANIKLSQGFGRLIRSMNDKGVVAILDTRLHTKSYGRAMLKSFPENVSLFTELDTVLGALNRLRETYELAA
jgi:ATP-dependent DNA helicase DinG